MVFWPISPGPHHGEPVARRGIAAVASQAVRGAGLSGGACRAGGRQRDAARGRVAPHRRHGRRAQDLSGADPPGAGGAGPDPAVHYHAPPSWLSLCGARRGAHGGRPSLHGCAAVGDAGPAPPPRGGRAPSRSVTPCGRTSPPHRAVLRPGRLDGAHRTSRPGRLSRGAACLPPDLCRGGSPV